MTSDRKRSRTLLLASCRAEQMLWSQPDKQNRREMEAVSEPIITTHPQTTPRMGNALCGHEGNLAIGRAGFVHLVIASMLLGGPTIPGSASAAWPVFGRAVCTASEDQLGPAIAPDGAAGAIITWHDRRTPAFNIFAQHVLASGEVDAAWPSDGRALLTDSLAQSIVPEGQEFPAIVSDCAGGAIVTWPDGRDNLLGLDIFVQHVLASGTVDSAWPVNGTLVCSARGRQGDPLIVSDGAGGAIVTWVDGRTGATSNDLDVYAQHVLTSGLVDKNWPVNGTALCTAPRAQSPSAILADGAGGAIVTWADHRNGNPGGDIFAQHVLSSGVVDPAWPVNGLAISAAPGTQSLPRIVSDGGSGAIITWHDDRDGMNHIYAQRVLTSGTIATGWPVDGLAVSTTGIDEVEATAVSDGSSGAIVAWGDAISGHRNIRAQHVLGAGVVDPAWPVTGVALSSTPSDETNTAIVSDGAGGAIVTWQVNFDIFAHHVLASGDLDPDFPIDGRPLCKLPDLQQNPAIVTAGPGGAIVTWMDRRNGIDFDVYALQVLAASTTAVGPGTGPAPGADPGRPTSEFTLEPPSPNPAFGAVTLRFALPSAARVRLAIYDAAGRRVRQISSGEQAIGDHPIAWDFRDEVGRTVGAGIYFARLEVEGRVLTRKFTKLK